MAQSKTNQPLISIVTVVYNGVTTLEKTILSVLRQTYPNIEYIIIDGGSTDGTLEIINKYREQLTYWISEPDNGIYDAMNKALKIVKGDWVYFLGSDDILHNILTTIAPLFKDKNTIYYGNVKMTNSQRIFCGEMNNFKILKYNICHQAIFYPKAVYQNSSYQIKYKVYADYILNLTFWTDHKVKFKYINYIIADYNELGFSGRNTDPYFFQNRRKVIKNNFPFIWYTYYLIRVELVTLIKKKLLIRK